MPTKKKKTTPNLSQNLTGIAKGLFFTKKCEICLQKIVKQKPKITRNILCIELEKILFTFLF